MTNRPALPMARLPPPRPQKTPCGECYLQPGEICDICGAAQTEEEQMVSFYRAAGEPPPPDDPPEGTPENTLHWLHRPTGAPHWMVATWLGPSLGWNIMDGRFTKPEQLLWWRYAGPCTPPGKAP